MQKKDSTPSGRSTLDLREHNFLSVRQALQSARSAICRDLAESTGLSKVTVGAILQEMVDTGVALEGDLLPSNGGRPSREYLFNERHSLVLVVFTRELEGKDTVCLRVSDLHGQVVYSQETELLPQALEDFDPFIDAILERYPRISSIGLGLPAFEYQGRLVQSDYPALVGTEVQEHFRRRYALPVVYENDVNAAALGRGSRPGAADTEAYLYFPRKYVPGAGIRVNGRLLRGNRHSAGEVRFLPLGIVWGQNLTDLPEESAEAVARVVVSLVAILDPDSVVLFGEFLTPDQFDRVRALCRQLLPDGMLPQISLSKDFTLDFQDGLIHLALELVGRNETNQH